MWGNTGVKLRESVMGQLKFTVERIGEGSAAKVLTTKWKTDLVNSF